MKALLLIAHGSRRQQSNDEVIELADKLKKNSVGQYDIIHAGFLELAETLIPDGIVFSQFRAPCDRRYS